MFLLLRRSCYVFRSSTFETCWIWVNFNHGINSLWLHGEYCHPACSIYINPSTPPRTDRSMMVHHAHSSKEALSSLLTWRLSVFRHNITCFSSVSCFTYRGDCSAWVCACSVARGHVGGYRCTSSGRRAAAPPPRRCRTAAVAPCLMQIVYFYSASRNWTVRGRIFAASALWDRPRRLFRLFSRLVYL